MARKAKKSTENVVETKVAEPVAVVAQTAPTVTPKLIVAQRKYERWYVYFKGVRPEENVGCGCKTAKSAIRYMYLLKSRHGATISQNILDRLQFEAQREG